MLLMQIEFEVHYTKNLFTIINSQESKVEFAFRIKDCNLEELLHLLYYGFHDEECTTSEEKLCVYLWGKNSKLFRESSTNEELKLMRIIRKYTEIHRNKLNPDSKVSYFHSVRKILSGEASLEVSYSLNKTFKRLEEKLKGNSLIKVECTSNDSELKKFNVLITNSADGIDSEKNYNNVLFIGSHHNQIVIGPLIHCDKFEIPFIVDEGRSELLDSENDLIAFFVERILFIIITELYDKAGSLPYVPNRYKLLINRAELTIQTEEQILTPRYLNDNTEA